MALTPRQFYITLKTKREKHIQRVRLDIQNAATITENTDEQQDHTGPAGTMTALVTGGRGEF